MLLCVSASPAPTPRKAYVATPAEITPSPTRNIHEKRADISDITSAAGDVTSAVANDINTVLSELGSNLPSYVASGVPNFFQGTVDLVVMDELSLTDDRLSYRWSSG